MGLARILLKLHMHLPESDLRAGSASVEHDDAHNVIAVCPGRQALPATRIEAVRRRHRSFSRQWEPVCSVWRVFGFSITSAGQRCWPDRDHATNRGRVGHVNLIAIERAPDFNRAYTRFVAGCVIEAVIGWSCHRSRWPLRTLGTLRTGRTLSSSGSRRADRSRWTRRAHCSGRARGANRSCRTHCADPSGRSCCPRHALRTNRPCGARRSCRTH